jgi:hypothetical protein
MAWLEQPEQTWKNRERIPGQVAQVTIILSRQIAYFAPPSRTGNATCWKPANKRSSADELLSFWPRAESMRHLFASA